jgi:hypothetical protein
MLAAMLATEAPRGTIWHYPAPRRNAELLGKSLFRLIDDDVCLGCKTSIPGSNPGGASSFS